MAKVISDASTTAFGVAAARALAAAIGRAELAEHPDFSRVSWRIVHNDEVDRLVSAWTCERAVDEIVATLRAADVPCSPVRRPIEAVAWPHLRARALVRPLLAPGVAPTRGAPAVLPPPCAPPEAEPRGPGEATPATADPVPEGASRPPSEGSTREVPEEARAPPQAPSTTSWWAARRSIPATPWRPKPWARKFSPLKA